MKLHLLLIILIASILLTLVACTKYVAGPKGEAGTPGSAGNLVVSQFSLTIKSSDWSALEATWIADVFSDKITPIVLQKGEVKVYVNVDGNWWVLPYGKDYIFTQSTLQEGKIRLVTAHIHGGVPIQPTTTNYRIVILAPAN